MKEVNFILNVKDDPSIYNEAMTSRDDTYLKETIDNEAFFVCSQTWILANLPLSSEVVGRK